jgi:hypothetical protein
MSNSPAALNARAALIYVVRFIVTWLFQGIGLLSAHID